MTRLRPAIAVLTVATVARSAVPASPAASRAAGALTGVVEIAVYATRRSAYAVGIGWAIKPVG